MGRSGPVYVITAEEIASLKARGIPLPPGFDSRGVRKKEDKKKPTGPRIIRYYQPDIPLSNKIPGECFKYERKMRPSITESRGAPPGVMYASKVEIKEVHRIDYNLLAPEVLDLAADFAAFGGVLAFTQEHQVYFNCMTGTVEAAVAVNDTEAVTFYNHYYVMPDQMIKSMTGDQFVAYVNDPILVMINPDGSEQVWLTYPDMEHYIRTTAHSLHKVTFDVRGVRYAGVNKNKRPANLDPARVRSVFLLYGGRK